METYAAQKSEVSKVTQWKTSISKLKCDWKIISLQCVLTEAVKCWVFLS